MERYLHGPVQGVNCDTVNINDINSINRRLQNEIHNWYTRQPSSALVSPAAAVGALGELSPGGTLMRGFQEQSLARMCLNIFSISVKYFD